MYSSRQRVEFQWISLVGSSDTEPPPIQQLTDKPLSGRRRRRDDLLVARLADGMQVLWPLVGEDRVTTPHGTVEPPGAFRRVASVRAGRM